MLLTSSPPLQDMSSVAYIKFPHSWVCFWSTHCSTFVYYYILGLKYVLHTHTHTTHAHSKSYDTWYGKFPTLFFKYTS